MKNILVEIKCNRCFYHTHIKSHTLVLPDLEPNLRKRILEKDMFTYNCPRCRQEISFTHPFLYHDKAHQFLIVVNQEDKNIQELQDQFPNTIVRLVKTTEELREKIMIFEDALQDYQMEHLKDILLKKYPSVTAIVYHDFDSESNSLWFTFFYENGSQDIKGIEMDVYQNIKEGRTRYE